MTLRLSFLTSEIRALSCVVPAFNLDNHWSRSLSAALAALAAQVRLQLLPRDAFDVHPIPDFCIQQQP
jgi:hypothetical protein